MTREIKTGVFVRENWNCWFKSVYNNFLYAHGYSVVGVLTTMF